MISGTGLNVTVSGIVGAQGPALGIRRANEVRVAPIDSSNGMNADGAKISFTTAARADSKYTVSQVTTEPVTPLKTLGSIVDARA